MRIIAIDCSARPDGLTARMSRAAADAAREAEADVEWLSLQDRRLERCRMCEPDGWGNCRRYGRCIIPDDLPALVEKIEAADRLIFATPVYYGDLSESAKTLTDRLRRLTAHPARKKYLRNLPTLAIAAAGGGGGGIPTCLGSIERAFSVPGCFLVDLIGVSRRNASYKTETVRIAARALAGEPADTWPARTALDA